jgi:glycosyltransferase involved in cell wall biosynthesis
VERKLKMLIVGAFPAKDIKEHGGILTSCRVLLASSLPRRMDLILVDSSSPTVPPPPFLRRLVRAGGRIVTALWHFVWSRPDVALLFASPGASFIEKTIMAAIARVLGIETLMFPRGAALVSQYERSRVQGFMRLCFRIPTLMLCQGVAYQEFFSKRIGFSLERCPILQNWTATPELLAIGAARRYGSRPKPLKVLFLGWIEREKGIFELLESVRRLSQTNRVPPFQVVLAGDGAAMAETRRELQAQELAALVELPGWINSQQKVERLRDADLLVLPSYMEGMPNAVIEAMAAGLPVVATDVGAVVDVVSDGVSGFVIPPRNADRLFEALLALLVDDDLRRRMGRAGWLLANERFSAEPAVERLVQLANTVCE